MNNLFANINKKLDESFSPHGKILFIIIMLVMIAALVFLGMSFYNKTNSQNDKGADVVDVEAPSVNNDSEEVNNEIDINIDQTADDRMVSIQVEDVGRANPFLPDGEGSVATRPTSMYGYSLMAPPENLNAGSDASRVVTTKVSGILYDAVSPSAILNIEGNDYLVRTGDYIHNYKVLSISKDLVTVQLGKNVYKAGVGQIMADATLNYNTVYDLQNRFGGAKK